MQRFRIQQGISTEHEQSIGANPERIRVSRSWAGRRELDAVRSADVVHGVHHDGERGARAGAKNDQTTLARDHWWSGRE